MSRIPNSCLVATVLCGLLAASTPAQTVQKPPEPDAASSAQHGIDLVAKGNCKDALPVLKKAIPHVADKQLKYSSAMATVRCAMSMNDVQTAVDELLMLNREYRNDAEVLYVTTHFFSELADRASQELATLAPTSHQAHELNAEAFESQEKWDEATAEYAKILEKEPNLPGIHYRLGRILLVKPPTPTTTIDAKKEFEAELKIDPANASAEYALGEIARQAQQWDEAIAHYSRASKLDEGFLEAFLGLGMSLNAAGKFSDAVGPLEKYVRMQPPDPAGHYQLAIAYARLGRKLDADREMALQREAEARVVQGAPRTQEKVLPQ
jgi:tetratricopeptide (TPR) repeat protein